MIHTTRQGTPGTLTAMDRQEISSLAHRDHPVAALAGPGAPAGEFDDLATTVESVTADGWTPVYAHVSTPGEWDDYEWSWTGSLSRWALDHPGGPDSAHALRAAAEHREG